MKQSYDPVPKSVPVTKRRKGLKPRSDKTRARDELYGQERDRFLTDHPFCDARWDDGCTTYSAEVHHMGGRAPSVFFRKAWWLPACSHCHHEITNHPEQAIERGLSYHTTGDPE